jgi:hypothetical protein
VGHLLSRFLLNGWDVGQHLKPHGSFQIFSIPELTIHLFPEEGQSKT